MIPAIILAVTLALEIAALLWLFNRNRKLVRAAQATSAPPVHVSRRFVEAATHELHTPLTAIIGYQELLADGVYGELDASTREAVQRIGRSAQHLMFLIDGILDAMLAESGELDLETDAVLVSDVLAMVTASARYMADERGLVVDIRLPERLPILNTDSTRLRRCLELALIAAIRAADSAQRLEITAEDADELRVSIGPSAISPAMLAPDLSVRASSDRLSLRLAVADRLARGLGGELALDSHPDGTGTLRIRIPSLPVASAV